MRPEEHGASGDRRAVSRRQFVSGLGAGFGAVALNAMLAQDRVAGARPDERGKLAGADSLVYPLAAKPPMLPTQAKACIFLFMFGGPSQVDLFDYKPVLQQSDGKTIQNEFRRGALTTATLQASRRKFAQYGQSGQWCSDALPHLAQHVDKMAIIKSLTSDSFAHGSALLQINSGRILQGHPTLGSWLTYGLGSENQNLPGYVVMLDPRGGPTSGAANWSSGYMPAAYQGTVLRSQEPAILNLQPSDRSTRQQQRQEIDLVQQLSRLHQAARPGYSELEARIATYELAFNMQAEAPEVLDLSTETQLTLEQYGITEPKPDWHSLALGPSTFGQQCLVARRMVERGVRFIQIYSGGGNAGGQNTWDAHHGIEENLRLHCPEVDRPISALLTDLEQRGLLESTLVVWGGEFGRMPVSETFNTGGKPGGRDHNPKGFTYWLAGAGVRPGVSIGETDEIGETAVVDPFHLRDLHATIQHLMGLDPQRLTYFHGGLDEKLTGVVEAQVIRQALRG